MSDWGVQRWEKPERLLGDVLPFMRFGLAAKQQKAVPKGEFFGAGCGNEDELEEQRPLKFKNLAAKTTSHVQNF